MDTEKDPELDKPIRRYDDVPAPRRREREQPVKEPEKEPIWPFNSW